MGLFGFLRKEQPMYDLEKHFYSEARELFVEGVMVEIFKNKGISVCNVGNAYYAVFLLDRVKQADIHFLLVSDEEIELVFQDSKNVSILHHTRPRNQKMLYIFNDRAKSTMRNSYKRVKTNPEEAMIDSKTEHELLKEYQHKNELHNR